MTDAGLSGRAARERQGARGLQDGLARRRDNNRNDDFGAGNHDGHDTRIRRCLGKLADGAGRWIVAVRLAVRMTVILFFTMRSGRMVLDGMSATSVLRLDLDAEHQLQPVHRRNNQCPRQEQEQVKQSPCMSPLHAYLHRSQAAALSSFLSVFVVQLSSCSSGSKMHNENCCCSLWCWLVQIQIS